MPTVAHGDGRKSHTRGHIGDTVDSERKGVSRFVRLGMGEWQMSRKVILILACVFIGVASLLVTGCAEDSSEDINSSSATESGDEEQSTAVDGEEESTEQGTSTEEGTEELSVFLGTWENPEGSVFRVITFREDGTADTLNYGDLEAEATWTLEDGYLKVETDGGESWGSPVEWISDAEFAWAYESGTWTLVP